MERKNAGLRLVILFILMGFIFICVLCCSSMKTSQINTDLKLEKTDALEGTGAKISLVEKTKQSIEKVDTNFYLNIIPSRIDTIYSHHTEYITIEKPNGERYQIPRLVSDKLELGVKDKSQIETKDWSKEFAQIQAKLAQQSSENLKLQQSIKTESKTSTTGFYWLVFGVIAIALILMFFLIKKYIKPI
jgi:hypothetical protein